MNKYFFIQCWYIFVVEKTVAQVTVDLLTGGSCGILSRDVGGYVSTFQPLNVAPRISNNISCIYSMRAQKNVEKVRFVLDHFDVQPTDCSLANLEFYDGVDVSVAPLITTLCPTDSISGRVFTGTDKYLSIKLNVANGDPLGLRFANFTAHWASFTDDKDPCAEANQMLCGNGNCIYDSLQCDGFDSCGDNSDESTLPPLSCSSKSPTENYLDLTPLYVTLALAFTFFIIYLLYALLSLDCFKSFARSCFVRCLAFARRKKRKLCKKLRESKYRVSKRSKKSASKISPQPSVKDLPVVETTSKKNLPLPYKEKRLPSLTIEEMEC